MVFEDVLAPITWPICWSMPVWVFMKRPTLRDGQAVRRYLNCEALSGSR